MTTITFRMVDNFFDRPAVQRAVDRAKKKQLSKAGAFVRKTARRSIKPAGKRAQKRKREQRFRRGADPTISKPGQPPRQHTTGRNLRLIFFAWEPQRESVVVGPVAFSAEAHVTSSLEHGGPSVIRRRGRQPKAVTVKARPFMAPALATEAPKFPNLFANSVKP